MRQRNNASLLSSPTPPNGNPGLSSAPGCPSCNELREKVDGLENENLKLLTLIEERDSKIRGLESDLTSWKRNFFAEQLKVKQREQLVTNLNAQLAASRK